MGNGNVGIQTAGCFAWNTVKSGLGLVTPFDNSGQNLPCTGSCQRATCTPQLDR